MAATSLAVWDIPMPVIAGEKFAIKAGAKGASGRVEVIGPDGAVVASAMLGQTPWPGTEALHWVALDLPAPSVAKAVNYAVRCGGAETWFSVVAAPKPDRTMTVQVTEQDSKEALGGVEIRLGPFHGRTDKAGRAEIKVCDGAYQLQLWRTAHISQPVPVNVTADASLALTMLHVPEEHPDARWVR